jgi:hypothetical protein
VLSQAALSGPKIDCSGGHAVTHAHLLGGEQTLGPQPAVAALQIEGLPDMSNFLEIEWLVLPGASALSIQNFCHLAITVMIQQFIDLGYHVRLRLANLSNWQRLG